VSDALADQLEGTREALRRAFRDLVDRDLRIAELEVAIHRALALHAAGYGDAFEVLRRVLEEPNQ
jgi:hypothetical protein